MQKRYLVVLFSFIIVLLMSCKGENHENSHIDRIIVHLAQEPQRLNPILATTLYETILSEHVFLSLCDYDPVTSEWVPVLATQIPERKLSTDESGNTITQLDIEILPDAIWSDGSPVTGYDVEFLLKILTVPTVNSPVWKSLIPEVIDVSVDKTNPKSFSIIMKGDYFRNSEAFLTAEIYPRHIYDPAGILSRYQYSDLRDNEKLLSIINDDPEVSKFGESFSSLEFSRGMSIEGAGAYRVKTWETGQYIVLEKKNNWWGDAYPERTLLKANPQEIVYTILEDATVAVTQLKSGELDVVSLSGASSQVFNDLKSDKAIGQRFDFYTPSLFRMYFILMNNQDPRLADINVRKALAHVLDVKRIIDLQEEGLGIRVNSPIHPTKKEYNNSVEFIEYDEERANVLLSESGWRDSDGDGVRDKTIDGINRELNFRYFISTSQISKTIASVLKESAAKVGINIELVTKSGGATRTENIIPGDYELTAQAITSSSAQYDPYQMWHSNSTGLNGMNWSGYNNPEGDKLIDIIRESRNNDERNTAYYAFQEIIAQDQPVLFLYAPVERFVISNKYKPVLSAKRPGFFVNAFDTQ